jgi:hypothetical protein
MKTVKYAYQEWLHPVDTASQHNASLTRQKTRAVTIMERSVAKQFATVCVGGGGCAPTSHLPQQVLI